MLELIAFLAILLLVAIAPGVVAFFALRACRRTRAYMVIWVSTLCLAAYWAWAAIHAYPKHGGGHGPGAPSGNPELLIWFVLYSPSFTLALATLCRFPRPFNLRLVDIFVLVGLTALVISASVYFTPAKRVPGVLTEAELVAMDARPKYRDGILVDVEYNGDWSDLYRFLQRQTTLERFRATVAGADGRLSFLSENENLRVLELEGDVGKATLTQPLTELKRLERIALNLKYYRGGGLAALKDLPNLAELDVSGTSIGDADLAELVQLTQLRTLKLNQSKVTDDGAEKLTALANLEVLALDGTEVTDQCFESIARFPKLIELSVRDTQVSKDGVDAFKAGHPGIEITR